MTIDDLHWIDSGSNYSVEQLVEVTEGSNCLLLLNFRPEYTPAWANKAHYQRLPLVTLGESVTRDLVRELLGSDDSVQSLANRIVEWTAGNPFFTEEAIRTLVEMSHLTGHTGNYQLTTDIDQLEVPANVHSILSARIDRLAESAKAALQTTSVIGRNFSRAVLEAAIELSPQQVTEALDRLKEKNFIRELSISPVAEYEFKNPLTNEVAYDSQLKVQRKRLHAAVAGAIESLGQIQLDENAGLLAHHWQQADDALRAARWHRRAADWVATTDVRASTRHWQSAQSLVKQLPDSSETSALGIESCRGLLNSGWRLGRSDETDLIFADGKMLAERSDDQRSLAVLCNLYGNVLGAGGDLQAYRDYAAEAVHIAEIHGEPGARRALTADLTTVNWFLGNIKEALALSSRCVAEQLDPQVGADVLGFAPEIHSLWIHACVLAEVGRLEEARTTIEQAITAAEALGVPEQTAWMSLGRVPIAFRAGDRNEALKFAEEAFNQIIPIGTPFLVTWAHIFLGMAHLLNSHWETAATYERGALLASGGRSVGFGFDAWAHTWLAEALLAQGELDAAMPEAYEALRLARRYGSRLFEIDALMACAKVSIRGRRAESQAAADLQAVSALVEQSGGLCRRGNVDELRAELADLNGDSAGAEQCWRVAHQHYLDAGALGHARRLEKLLDTSQSARSAL